MLGYSSLSHFINTGLHHCNYCDELWYWCIQPENVMDRRSLLAKLGGRFIPMIWVVLDFLEPTCSIFVFFLIFIDNVSVFLCGFGVGGHGSYMCEESWCDYQGRVHHGSYLGTFTTWSHFHDSMALFDHFISLPTTYSITLWPWYIWQLLCIGQSIVGSWVLFYPWKSTPGFWLCVGWSSKHPPPSLQWWQILFRQCFTRHGSWFGVLFTRVFL